MLEPWTPVDAELAALRARLLEGERRALAKAITLVESTLPAHQERAQRLLSELLPFAGKARRIGVTGVPGVGKSTFIEAFGLMLVEAGHRIAVLAVDPSSVRSRGSILGDKTRMPRLAVHEAAFVRPSPSGGSLGGVARRTREALLLCEAAGYDVVLVETVGVGQSEVAVAGMVDFFLMLGLAGGGDELQGIKRGILEVADAVMFNKADGDNRVRAERAAAEARAALRLLRGRGQGWEPVVGTVSALEGRGLAALWEVVEAHREQQQASGRLDAQRAAQRRTWFEEALNDGLREAFEARADVARLLPELRRAVDEQRITPTEAARRALALLHAPPVGASASSG